MARRIARVSVEAKLDINEENYVEHFRPFLMDVCHAWCNGASFLQLCKMTDIFEGMFMILVTLKEKCFYILLYIHLRPWQT